MALAYPEGECFFVRSGLATSQSDGYHADNAKDFYSNMLVEFVWNLEVCKGEEAGVQYLPDGMGGRWMVPSKTPKYSHPRAGYRVVDAEWGHNSLYGCWDTLPFSYGPENSIKRRDGHDLCTNGNRFFAREDKGTIEAWFMQMPMPTKEEQWVWIDMLGYIRAIYIPIAHQSSKQYPHMCTFIQINFAAKGKVDIWRPDISQFANHDCDKVTGLGVHYTHSLGLNVFGLLRLLALPRQLRNADPYESKMIQITRGIDRIATVATSPDLIRKNGYDFDFPKILEANFGLELQWLPHTQDKWFEDYMKNLITLGIGFVPGIGPILAVSFVLGWSALTDPDSFFATLKTACPPLLLTDGVIRELQLEATLTKAFLPAGWDQVGKPFQIPPAQIQGELGTDQEKSLDDVPKSESVEKTKKVIKKSREWRQITRKGNLVS
ncbi:MAG: hypothetical protein Q9191_001674 [Dirinaria sp. TL-2023a]